MNLSLTNRVKITFIIANGVVLITGFLMYFFLGTLADKTKNIWDELQSIRELDEISRSNIVELTVMSVNIEEKAVTEKRLITYRDKANELRSNLERLKAEYKDSDTRSLVQALLQSVDTLIQYIGEPDNKKSLDRVKDSNFQLTLVTKVSNDFSAYLKKSQLNNQDSSERVKNTIASIKKNMLLVLILAFLGTIVLSWLVPNKVALPFKKINHAIEELQNCNFDVSIAYEEEDEIGELSTSLNKMIAQLKQHEELRSDKFMLESRKFNIIANHIDAKVLVANSEGKLSYMNNELYSMLKVETSEVIDKELEESVIPESIVSVFDKALKRRGKIENEEITFDYKKLVDEEEQEASFSGYAEVYPIRGKESSLDYYLMIINEEMTS